MKQKNKRLFIEPTGKSTLFLDVPTFKHYDTDYEVTMRDCSRQTHWMFGADKKGIAKAKKVAKFFNELVTLLEEGAAKAKEMN